MTTQDSSTYWKRARVELRAAGFDPDRAAKTSAVVTIASAWTNAHRCNNRVRGIADMLIEILGERGGQGLVVGAPAVSDALTQGTPTAGYSLVSRDVVADCIEIGHYAHHGDAMIVISGCDKTGAAALMPLARTNAVGLVQAARHDLESAADPRLLELAGQLQQPAQAMSTADVLVLPSFAEGLPLVALEAARLGIPCLLSNIAVHREMAALGLGLIFQRHGFRDFRAKAHEIADLATAELWRSRGP